MYYLDVNSVDVEVVLDVLLGVLHRLLAYSAGPHLTPFFLCEPRSVCG